MKKNMRFLMVICVLALCSCKKELPRDNPNDINNPNGYKTGMSFTKAVITADVAPDYSGSHDGHINLSENIQFKVYLKNTGQKIIHNVIGSIPDPNNRDVENFGNSNGTTEVSFGNITPGAEVASNETMQFTVSGPDIAKVGDNLSFTINYTDDDGDVGSANFSFYIEAFKAPYNFKQLQPQLLSSDQWDGAIRAGANIVVGLEIQNSTSSSCGDIKTSYFTSGNSDVYGYNPDLVDFGTFSSKETSSQISIGMSISYNASPYTTEVIKYNLIDEFGNTWPESFSFALVQ